MSAPTLRPLRVGEILDASIKLYLSNAKTLIGLGALVVVPFEILSALVLLSIVPTAADLPRGFSGTTTPVTMDRSAVLGGQAVNLVTTLVVSLLVTAMCVRAVSDRYLDQPADFRSALRFTLRRFLPLSWVQILAWILLVLATIAFVAPGIYLFVAWSVCVPALLIEDRRGWEALKRSRELVKGRWWPTFGTLVASTVLVGVVSSAIQAVLLGVIFSTSDSLVVGVVLVSLSGTVSLLIAEPFQAVVRTVLYYDLRVRREGYDVEVLAAGLGFEAPPQSGPSYLGPDSVGTPGGPPFWPPPPGWTPPDPHSPPTD